MKSYIKASLVFRELDPTSSNVCLMLFDTYEQLLNYLCKYRCQILDYEMFHLIKHRKEFKKNV